METIDNSSIVGTSMVLQNLYTTFSHNFDLQLVHSNGYSNIVTQENIENILELEMQRITKKHFEEEENFVNRMIAENPIANERRSISQKSSNKQIRDPNQLQRAESCRKSRMNNKIKKAKLRYRHKFVSAKLINSSNILNCIRDVITKSEQKLIDSGLDAKSIMKLRSTIGMEGQTNFIKDFKTPEHNKTVAANRF